MGAGMGELFVGAGMAGIQAQPGFSSGNLGLGFKPWEAFV